MRRRKVGTNVVTLAFIRPEVGRGYWTFQELYKSCVMLLRAPVNFIGHKISKRDKYWEKDIPMKLMGVPQASDRFTSVEVSNSSLPESVSFMFLSQRAC